MGVLEWNREDDGWVATVRVTAHPFRILIGGDDRPDERLLAHARDIYTAPEKLVGQVNDLLRKEAHDFPDWREEMSGLYMADVALLWPDDPDGGIIYLDAPERTERRWQCDLVDRQAVEPLSYDD